MFYVNLLTPNDLDAAFKVCASRSTFLNITDSDYLQLQQHMAQINLRSILDPFFSTLGLAFGVWEHGKDEMQGLVTTLFSNQQPCYYINKAYTIPGADIGVLPATLRFIMDYHEQLGYRRFYALYSKSVLETYKRLWRKSALLQNYSCYTEYESAPNERPKFQEFWELLYGRMLYNDVMIVRAFIQNEHARPARPTSPSADSVLG